MTRLELTDEEARELAAALEIYLHGLRGELAAADARDFKSLVRERLQLLELVAERLHQATAEGDSLH